MSVWTADDIVYIVMVFMAFYIISGMDISSEIEYIRFVDDCEAWICASLIILDKNNQSFPLRSQMGVFIKHH